jgi:hypothetical protein
MGCDVCTRWCEAVTERFQEAVSMRRLAGRPCGVADQVDGEPTCITVQGRLHSLGEHTLIGHRSRRINCRRTEARHASRHSTVDASLGPFCRMCGTGMARRIAPHHSSPGSRSIVVRPAHPAGLLFQVRSPGSPCRHCADRKLVGETIASRASYAAAVRSGPNCSRASCSTPRQLATAGSPKGCCRSSVSRSCVADERVSRARRILHRLETRPPKESWILAGFTSHFSRLVTD